MKTSKIRIRKNVFLANFSWDLVNDFKLMSLFNKEPFIFGSLSSSVACILLQPLDVIKTRLQEQDILTSKINQRQCRSFVSMAKNIFCTSGPRGYWRGLSSNISILLNYIILLGPTLFRNVPGTGLYFWTLEFLRKYDSSNSPISNMIQGSVARVFAGQLLMPCTVIKIRREVKYTIYKILTLTLRVE